MTSLQIPDRHARATCLGLLILCACVARAGDLSVAVVDPMGHRLSDARCSLTSIFSGEDVASFNCGQIQRNLVEGRYLLRASASGFAWGYRLVEIPPTGLTEHLFRLGTGATGPQLRGAQVKGLGRELIRPSVERIWDRVWVSLYPVAGSISTVRYSRLTTDGAIEMSDVAFGPYIVTLFEVGEGQRKDGAISILWVGCVCVDGEIISTNKFVAGEATVRCIF